MSDIIDELEEIRPYNYNKTDDELQFIAQNAIKTILKLRLALRVIGYDYVELSHEKVQYLYLEHMRIAKKAYQDSFLPGHEAASAKTEPKSLDDNF